MFQWINPDEWIKWRIVARPLWLEFEDAFCHITARDKRGGRIFLMTETGKSCSILNVDIAGLLIKRLYGHIHLYKKYQISTFFNTFLSILPPFSLITWITWDKNHFFKSSFLLEQKPSIICSLTHKRFQGFSLCHSHTPKSPTERGLCNSLPGRS